MSALEVTGDRFVRAYTDLSVSRNGIRSTIPAGSYVRADDDVVAEAPEAFYTPTTYRFHFEVRELTEDSLHLRSISYRQAAEDLPPPGPTAADDWAEWFSARFSEQGADVRDLSVERIGESTFVVRAELDKHPSDVHVVDSIASDGTRSRRIERTYQA